MKSLSATLLALSLAFFLPSCEKHGHDHDDDHADHEGEHAHEDGHEHEDGDHADADHEHGDEHGEDHEHAGGEEHDHAANVAGPNAGRVLLSIEPHLEFLVTEDRKVTITALDEDLKAIPVEEQGVTVIGGERSNPTRLNFAKEGDVLVSDAAFPEGNNFPVVVQITTAPDAAPVSEKFNLNLSDCPTCENQEYACTCDHAE